MKPVSRLEPVNRLEAGVVAVARALDQLGVPYMVIGGFAVTVWGEPRLTQDVDVTIEADAEDTALVGRLAELFVPRTAEPTEFARRTRVLPVETAERVRVDLVFAGLPYERTAIRRAISIEVGGYPIRVCAPEDLIILKIVSPRPRDREDICGVVRRQRRHLDRGYLDPIVAELASALAQPDLLAFYTSLWEE